LNFNTKNITFYSGTYFYKHSGWFSIESSNNGDFINEFESSSAATGAEATGQLVAELKLVEMEFEGIC
jgi:hypothetical protein